MIFFSQIKKFLGWKLRTQSIPKYLCEENLNKLIRMAKEAQIVEENSIKY